MNIKHYTYRVTWSPEDDEHLGLCAEFPLLSWLSILCFAHRLSAAAPATPYS